MSNQMATDIPVDSFNHILLSNSNLPPYPFDHFNPHPQQSSGKNKRELSPGSPTGNDSLGNGERRSESEEGPSEVSPGPISAKIPSALRVKGIKKRYRKENISGKSITYLLDALDRDQILQVVEKVTENNPSIRNAFLAAIPRPTLNSVEIAFLNLEKRMHDSFPYSREGPNRDRYAFTRVKPRIIEIREAVDQYAEHFFLAEKEMPSTIFNFLKLSTDLAHRLPVWNHNSDNQIKKEFYFKLVGYWNMAIELAANKMEEGKLFGAVLVTEWASDLDRHNTVSEGLFQSSIALFKQKLGWVIGIGPAPANNSFRFYPFGM